VRTSTALPWPTSKASTSKAPGGGRAGCHSSTGSIKGRPRLRSASGQRITSSSPPSKPAAAHHQGAAARSTTAQDACDKTFKICISRSSKAAARGQAGGKSTPIKASGVTAKVTQGMASALANKPTSETC
jgi:hypothetical protein